MTDILDWEETELELNAVRNDIKDIAILLGKVTERFDKLCEDLSIVKITEADKTGN